MNSLDNPWLMESVSLGNNPDRLFIAEFNQKRLEIWYSYKAKFPITEIAKQLPDGVLTIIYPKYFIYDTSQKIIQRNWIKNHKIEREEPFPASISIVENKLFCAFWYRDNEKILHLSLDSSGIDYVVHEFGKFNQSNLMLKEKYLDICLQEGDKLLNDCQSHL